jgi:peptide/nickel transport system permease protein
VTTVAKPTPPPGGIRLALSGLRRHAIARFGAIALVSLFIVAIFADALAAELPIACRYKGERFLFANVTQPAELAGLDCDSMRAADPGGFQLPPLVCHGPAKEDESRALREPFALRGHPLGTDAKGRDVFARVVHGTRTSLTFALVTALAFVALGTVLGAIVGFRGGPIDAMLARLVDTLTAFPTLVLAIGIQALVPKPSAATLFLAIGLTKWTEVYRLVRAEVQHAGTRDYVLAARALGATPTRVLVRHILPNTRSVAIVAATYGVASVVLAEASLTFLRVGREASAPSWGELLSQVRDHPAAWWLLAFPGLMLLVTVAAYHVVGEALRDVLDPHARHAGAESGALPPTTAIVEHRSAGSNPRSG